MLEDYQLIFNKEDYNYYNKLFEQIYSDKFKTYCFQQIYSDSFNSYNFTDRKYIDEILQQDNGKLKYNKIISDFIQQDFNCISKHFFKNNEKYIENTKGQFFLQIDEMFDIKSIDGYNLYYQHKDNNTVFYFCKNNLIQNVSPLFDNFNNKLHNFNNFKKNNIVKYLYIRQNTYFKDYQNITIWDECYSQKNSFRLTHCNNIFDQNWYNRFCHNFKIFLQSEIK